MGLDSFFYTTLVHCVPEGKVTDFEFEEYVYDHVCENVYLRKEWDVHNFMFELYKEKGGVEDSNDFNGIPLILTIEDLELIENKLQSQEIALECMDEIRAIKNGFAKIKKLIKTGKIVAFYDSSW